MAKVPAELHLFQEGAHGFGVREGGSPLAAWPGLALAWMRALGFLDPAHVRGYPGKFREAVEKGGNLPRISESKAGTTLDEAYAAQRRLTGASTLKVAGHKGAMTSAAAQKKFGVEQPLHCVVFEPSLLKAEGNAVVALSEIGPSLVETEIGYIMGVDIPTKIADADEARTASQAVVAVVEIPVDLGKRMDGAPKAVDFVASNCGDATRVIVGEQHHPDKVDLDALAISLSRGDKVLHKTTGAATKGGQWANLMMLINQIVEQGRTIREGDLILSGSIGPAHVAETGSYSAEFGELGTVEFEVK
jgi:2-keto-4-pentenoate hydratase